MRIFFCGQANFLRFIIFPISHQNTCCLLNIKYIFKKCWHCLAVVAPAKYERLKEPDYFCEAEISLMEKLMNRTLVTPTSDQLLVRYIISITMLLWCLIMVHVVTANHRFSSWQAPWWSGYLGVSETGDSFVWGTMDHGIRWSLLELLSWCFILTTIIPIPHHIL